MLVRVEPLIEILDDAFGVNNYSRQISADFNRGFEPTLPLFIASAVFRGRYERHEWALSDPPEHLLPRSYVRN